VAVFVNFNSLKAVYTVTDQDTGVQFEASVRRLSSCSYAEDGELVSSGGGKTEKFVTQWRWFWCSGVSWLQFGEVSQTHQIYWSVLLLHGFIIHCVTKYILLFCSIGLSLTTTHTLNQLSTHTVLLG